MEHNFGGPWTLIKLDVLEAYLKAYTLALKNQGLTLTYIDAFAGTGQCTVQLGDSHVTEDGSAIRALNVEPAFQKYIFIENEKPKIAALKKIQTNYPDRNIEVIEGDANQVIRNLCASAHWGGQRAVLFLDPYGMEVDWHTLEVICATQAIDLWYLFPLSGLYRQATRKRINITEDKRQAINRILGTNEWEQDIYSHSGQLTLLDNDEAEYDRIDVEGLIDYVSERLKQLFPGVSHGLLLKRDNIPMFTLYCAIANEQPKAIGLALKLANYIIDSQPR
ncbi:MAG TPA: three-Cys-motif partner protein TcmP [Thiotrichales bacterium]|nr:three-Cys-motif partner protein TcmP [Thiotrichales bacterium]